MVPEWQSHEDKELTALMALKLASSEETKVSSCLTASVGGLGLAPFL